MSTTAFIAPELGDIQVTRQGNYYIAETYADVKGQNRWIPLCGPMPSVTEAFNKITISGRYLP